VPGSARRSGAVEQLWRALLGHSGHRDNNKWYRRTPHLLARLRGSFAVMGRRRRRSSVAAALARVPAGLGRGCIGATRVSCCGSGVAAALNRPRTRPLHAGHAWEGVRAAARTRGQTRARVRLGCGAGTGMPCGSHLSAAAGTGERRWAGDARWAGWAKLLCWAAMGKRRSGLQRGRTRPKRKRGAGGLWLAGLEAEVG
jgi:hypothetical protein